MRATPVPAYLEADLAAGTTRRPPDGSRPGEYHVNLRDPTGRGRAETASICFHEAIPGHHLQLAIATERTSLPAFRRLSWGHTAFVEAGRSTPSGWPTRWACTRATSTGWACWPVTRGGVPAGGRHRAARPGLTRQQAIDFMVANAPVDHEEIEVEVDRYVGMPSQALAYKVGQREILWLRAEARAALAPASPSPTSTTPCKGTATVSLPVCGPGSPPGRGCPGGLS